MVESEKNLLGIGTFGYMLDRECGLLCDPIIIPCGKFPIHMPMVTFTHYGTVHHLFIRLKLCGTEQEVRARYI